ncbi:hypothetical protein ACFL47_00640 [Candidatus Latescibacterota bacterium]
MTSRVMLLIICTAISVQAQEYADVTPNFRHDLSIDFSQSRGIIPVIRLQRTDTEKPEGETSNTKSRFYYGYGVHGVMLILPTPYFESGAQFGPVDLRGAIGFNLAYFDARFEASVRKALKNREIEVFVNGGVNSVVQVGTGVCYGLGIDIHSVKKDRFYRIEAGVFKPDDSSTFQAMPRLGIGWRFDD